MDNETFITIDEVKVRYPEAYRALADEIIAFLRAEYEEALMENDDARAAFARERLAKTEEENFAFYTEDYFYVVYGGHLEHHGHPSEPRKWDGQKWVPTVNRYNV